MQFMDMIFKRYACPFSLLDEMIDSCSLYDFIVHIVKTTNQENKEKVQWEFYLHKVYEKTYAEFVESIDPLPDVEELEEPNDLETTIKETMDIFNIELNN